MQSRDSRYAISLGSDVYQDYSLHVTENMARYINSAFCWLDRGHPGVLAHETYAEQYSDYAQDGDLNPFSSDDAWKFVVRTLELIKQLIS